MNYRHIFHAGNPCDIVKHAVLVLLLEHLRAKDSSIFVLDSHAGIGLYDLTDPRAQKTGEAETGLFRLLAAPALPALAGYYAILEKLNPGWRMGSGSTADTLRFYPGSPLLAYHLLRPQDRLVACELHPEDAKELRRLFYDKKTAHIHHRDGYEALRAFLPPEEKRGLVLIDPPYENPDEFSRLSPALAKAHHSWSQGYYTLWYPIKDRPTIWRFHEELIGTGIPKILCAEFIFEEEIHQDRLNGSGLILVNPPWKFEEKLQQLFTDLHQAMGSHHDGISIRWLNP